jgi:energy-converting hydrogenase Eha subunit E
MMVAISFFLMNVETKQLGMVTLFMTSEEIIMLMVFLFAKSIITPPFV